MKDLHEEIWKFMKSFSEDFSPREVSNKFIESGVALMLYAAPDEKSAKEEIKYCILNSIEKCKNGEKNEIQRSSIDC